MGTNDQEILPRNGFLTENKFLNWQIKTYSHDQSEIKTELERKVTWTHFTKWEEQTNEKFNKINFKLAFWAGMFSGLNGLITFLITKYA